MFLQRPALIGGPILLGKKSLKDDAGNSTPLCSHPVTLGGMPAVELKDEEMKALIAYLQELK